MVVNGEVACGRDVSLGAGEGESWSRGITVRRRGVHRNPLRVVSVWRVWEGGGGGGVVMSPGEGWLNLGAVFVAGDWRIAS